MDGYNFWKTAHILSAAVLFGAGMGIAFFCWCGYRRAMRLGEIAVLRATLRLTVIADYSFTAPAVVFQPISGLMLMNILGWPSLSPWSLAVWGLYLLTGACWIPVVFIQIALSRAAERASSMAALPAEFHKWFRWWFALGIPAFLAVALIFALMVAKPYVTASV